VSRATWRAAELTAQVIDIPNSKMTPENQQRQLTECLRDCARAAQVRDEIIKVQKTPGVEPPLHARSLARTQCMTQALEGWATSDSRRAAVIADVRAAVDWKVALGTAARL